MKAGSTAMTKRHSSQWKYAGSPRPKKARQSKSTHKLLIFFFFFFFFFFFDSTGMIYMHWVPTGYSQQGILCWGFKGVQGRDFVGRGWHSSNRVSGISTRTMHQSTTPSLSQTIWPRWASTQFVILPIVETLLPVTFAYSLSSEAVVMRQLRRWKRLWRRSLIRGLPWGLPEVVGTVQVHCNRKRLLRRGLEFHMYNQ